MVPTFSNLPSTGFIFFIDLIILLNLILLLFAAKIENKRFLI